VSATLSRLCRKDRKIKLSESLSAGLPNPKLRNRSESGYDERILPDDVNADPLHLARYLFASHWAPGRSVVEFCCGLGYGAAMLSAAGAVRVLGVDIDPRVTAAADQRFGTSQVNFICADAGTPLELQSADLAICFEGIEHVEHPDALLMNMAGLLTTGGTALISTPNASQYEQGHSGNPYHLREYSLDQLTGLLLGYFKWVDIYFQWNSGDPFDFSWNFRTLARSLVPIPIKHFLRSRLAPRGSAPAAPSFSERRLTGYSSRPFPLAYLSLLPGLKHAQPSIWVAVCQEPRNAKAERLEKSADTHVVS
jgi:2-polyprenyl-3-methyl-5-hydroxy-6-metoxy-1,4-benzoquinol methylase